MPNRLPSGLGIGLALTAIIAALAVFAGTVAPVDPLRTGAAPLQPPSSHHLLGTDELGRDLWSNIAYGARASLLVGGLAALLSTATGVAVGVAAGYYGRAVDEGLMRFAEMFQIIPGMLVALLLVAFFGGRLWTVIPVIAFTGWPLTARVVRSEVLSLREREFVLEARALGGRDAHIISRHLLPNAFPAVLIGLPLQVGRAILLEAGLSFLGLGDPGAASWGKLLQSAQEYMRDAWWLALFPGVALTVTVLALYLVAEELHARTTPLLAPRHRGLLEWAHHPAGPASPPAPQAGLPRIHGETRIGQTRYSGGDGLQDH
jgi:peptide/nickel transport system permease protein